METVRPLNFRPLLLIGTLVAAVVAGFLVGSSQYVRPVPCYTARDWDPAVDKAIDVFRGKMSRAEVRKLYDVNLVYLPTMTCVGFNLLPKTAGGDSAVCFDDAGRVLRYTNGV